MSSAELRNKTELTTIAGTEWIYTQEAVSPYTVKKMAIDTLTSPFGFTVADSFIFRAKHTAISSSFPWFNMSLPDQNWTTDHYSADFIAEMRSRKVIYDELDTAVSSFTGSWSSGTFTLDNNTANNAMLAELAEEYLFAGSPTTNWRLLNDGTYDYNVTGITVASRQITVSTADHTPSGTSIEIYLHRVYGSTTSARHHSWAGLGLYMIGGNKVSGLRRRDALQQFVWKKSGTGTATGQTLNSDAGGNYPMPWGNTTGTDQSSFWAAASGTLRTASKTRIESGTLSLYLYVGSYTA